MKLNKNKIVSYLVFVLLISAINISAQEKQDSTSKTHMMSGNTQHMMQQKSNSSVHKKMNHRHMMQTDSTADTQMMHDNMNQMRTAGMSNMQEGSIVREGVIDLKAIDANKDGKVFQDMMDWNVISDEAGNCPVCGMRLKEVTLDQAKQNLIKHGCKVKE